MSELAKMEGLLKGVNAQMGQFKTAMTNINTSMGKGTQALRNNSKAVEENKKEYFSLASAQKVATDTTDSFARRFAEAAQGTGKASKAWTMFSRVLSGSPLWKMQNYIRSAGQAMDFYYSSTEKAVEQANEQAAAMGKLTTQLKGVEEQLDLLQKADSHAELFETNLEYANAYSAILSATKENEIATLKEMANAESKAKARTLNMYEKVQGTLLKNQKESGQALVKAMETEELVRKKNYRRVGYDETKKFLRNTILTKKDLKIYRKAQEEKKKLDKALKTAKAKVKVLKETNIPYDPEEMKKRKKEVKKARGAVAGKKGEMMALQKLTQGGAGDFDKLESILKDQQEKRSAFWKMNLEGANKIWKGTEKFMTFGLGFKKIYKAIRNPVKTLKAANKRFKELRATVKKNGGGSTLRGMWKGIKGPMSMVGKVMKGAMMGMLYFMLFLLGAFLVFSIIKDIFKKAEVMETIMNVLSGVFDGVKTILSGVFDIFGAFFGSGTFGERLQLLIGGIGKIFGGIGKILWSVLKGIGSLAWKVVVAYVTFVINLWKKIIKTFVEWITKPFEGVWNWLVDTWVALKAWVMDTIWKPIDTYVISPITDFFTTVGELVDTVLDWLGGGGLGDAAGDAWDATTDFLGFDTGGTAQGGLAMVGERGPELINMPKGTSVHSNDTTKGMTGNHTTNNVSVNVSGRVGASDSELRDIAKKIGRMVSTEINRTTSSSTNMRG